MNITLACIIGSYLFVFGMLIGAEGERVGSIFDITFGSLVSIVFTTLLWPILLVMEILIS